MAPRPTTPPDPPLSDGVILLRPWTRDDVAELTIATNDTEIERWLDQIPMPYTEADALSYIQFGESGWRGEGPESTFAIVELAAAKPVGSLGVRWANPEERVANVGYWVRRETRGRGYVTRAVRLAAGWVLNDLRFERLELRVDPLNIPSCRVAERVGFTLDGTLRSARYNYAQKRRIDLHIYSLLPGELKPA